VYVIVTVFFQKGQKTDVISVLVKLEFGDRTIGESAKVECFADQDSEVNYSATLPVSPDDAFMVDELASKPLLCMCSYHSCFALGTHSFNMECESAVFCTFFLRNFNQNALF